MGNYVKLIFGALLVVASIAGSIKLMTGGAQESVRRIVANGTDTTGVVEKRVRHIVAGRYGKAIGGGVYYSLTYSFTTLEGQKYGGTINVTKEQAYSVGDGEQIQVRYNKQQPTINAPLRFKEYMTNEDADELPFGTMIFTSLLMLLGGAWLAWSGGRHIIPGLMGNSGGPAYAAPGHRAAAAGVNRLQHSPPRTGFGQR